MALFAAGITLSPDGGALVVIEKRPRKTGRIREAYGEKEPEWQDDMRVVGAERLTGTVPEMVAHLATRLKADPMVGDTTAKLDITAIGKPVMHLVREQRMNPWPVLIGGEKEATDTTGTTTVPVQVLQGVATMMLQSKRLEVVSSLRDGPTLLRSLEQLESLPASGPTRDLGIAAAIAVWTAHTHRSCGPWASSKPAPVDSNEEWVKAARTLATRRALASQQGRPWWSVMTPDEEW